MKRNVIKIEVKCLKSVGNENAGIFKRKLWFSFCIFFIFWSTFPDDFRFTLSTNFWSCFGQILVNLSINCFGQLSINFWLTFDSAYFWSTVLINFSTKTFFRFTTFFNINQFSFCSNFLKTAVSCQRFSNVSQSFLWTSNLHRWMWNQVKTTTKCSMH